MASGEDRALCDAGVIAAVIEALKAAR